MTARAEGADDGRDDPADLVLPDGLRHVRTTATFTVETVPEGLRRAHRLATGVWGRLRVEAGSVTYVLEASGRRRVLAAGDTQVIEPDVVHHVEPSDDARFCVEFHR